METENKREDAEYFVERCINYFFNNSQAFKKIGSIIKEQPDKVRKTYKLLFGVATCLSTKMLAKTITPANQELIKNIDQPSIKGGVISYFLFPGISESSKKELKSSLRLNYLYNETCKNQQKGMDFDTALKKAFCYSIEEAGGIENLRKRKNQSACSSEDSISKKLYSFFENVLTDSEDLKNIPEFNEDNVDIWIRTYNNFKKELSEKK